ncbi:MAG: TraR/DksA C4-type zinc finger protein [Chloroflexota bacterium]
MAIAELKRVRARKTAPAKAGRAAKSASTASRPKSNRGIDRARAADVEKLDALKLRLHEDMATLAQQDGERTPYGGDFESLVTAAQLASQHETDELLRRRLERRLTELDHVQKRLEQGSYGKCEQCGQQIPEDRLEAMPDTVMCVPCQRLKERTRLRGWRRAA